MKRATTISISYDEKDKPDRARVTLFGTGESPYGVVIWQLAAAAFPLFYFLFN